MADRNSAPDPNLDKYNELRQIVLADATDFDTWTKLITAAEKLDEKQKVTQVYDEFLAEFPLCYGYWKKYASLETRHAGNPAAIYERGLQVIPYSVDLWVYYIEYVIGVGGEAENVRALFERAVQYVSSDYLAHTLWDKYLEYEFSQQATVNILHLYGRILRTPIQQLDRFYQSFTEYVKSRTVHELLSASEIEQAKEGIKLEESEGDEALSSEDRIKQGITESHTVLYNTAKAKLEERSPFENCIKRPYFHVKPLDSAQIVNWNSYLDFEEKGGDLTSIVKLYERCLIPCAAYPSFWIRYAVYMESAGEVERAREVLERATAVHTKRKHECHLWKARFQERQKDVDGARKSYANLLEVLPGLIQAIVAFANMERRVGNIENACKVFEDAAEKEKVKPDSAGITYAYIIIHYARFAQLVIKDVKKARQIYEEALDFSPQQRILWEGYLLLESLNNDSSEIVSLMRRALKSSEESQMPQDEREQLSLHCLEYADFVGSLDELQSLSNSHMKAFSSAITDNSKKRALEHTDSLQNKRAATDGQAAQTIEQQQQQHATPASADAYAASGYYNYGYQQDGSQAYGYGYQQDGSQAYANYYGYNQ